MRRNERRRKRSRRRKEVRRSSSKGSVEVYWIKEEDESKRSSRDTRWEEEVENVYRRLKMA